jgi:hypothetical protein
MVWYHADMIDFPIAELLDDSICLLWLERHLHPDGLAWHCQINVPTCPAPASHGILAA